MAERFSYVCYMNEIAIKLLDEFNVSSPVFIAETDIATIWRVRCSDGTLAVLKVYKGCDMRNEGPGFDFLRMCDGQGAAKVFQTNANAALMEFLEGPSLGDMARGGDDQKAAEILVDVANNLHANRLHISTDWPKLQDFATDLTDVARGANCTDGNWKNFEFSRDLAFHLIEHQRDIRPLHGDLHHDNVLRGQRGYCAIDAKGVVGARAYELANAFRNPKGAETLVQNADRFSYLLDLWCEKFAIDKAYMLDWAIAKTAFSIMWRDSKEVGDDPDFSYLDMIIAKRN